MVTDQQPTVTCLKRKGKVKAMRLTGLLNDGPVERLRSVSQSFQIARARRAVRDICAAFHDLAEVWGSASRLQGRK